MSAGATMTARGPFGPGGSGRPGGGLRPEAPRQPRELPPGRASLAFALAVLFHGLLFAVLFFGLRWQSQAPEIIQAEVWTAAPQIAAPPPAPPEPAVRQRAAPEPAPPAKPDIALKRTPEKKQPPPKTPPPPEPKVAPKGPVDPKAPPARAVPQLETPVRPVAPPEPKTPSDLQNLLAQAARPGTGTAARSGSPGDSNSYIAAIQAKVRSNLRFPVPANLVGNPEAVFLIEQLPTGEIVRVSKRKPSGLPGFDEAVERAINASSPLPKARDGSVERSLELVFNPIEKK